MIITSKYQVQATSAWPQWESTAARTISCQLFCLDSLTVQEFKALAESPKNVAPSHTTDAELEAIYWKSLSDGAAVYGQNVHSTLTDPDLDAWNLDVLPSMLDLAGLIPGITDSYLYFGSWRSSFAIHKEDMDLYSINLLHFGKSKSWYAVPPSYARELDKAFNESFPQTASVCPNSLRHKTTLLSPQWLREHNIPYNFITQSEGEIIITFPSCYHQGFNHGYNCAEATNFAEARWIPYGLASSSCLCRTHRNEIEMDIFVKRFYPLSYPTWRDEQKLIRPVKRYQRKTLQQMHPEFNIAELLENPSFSPEVKSVLRKEFRTSSRKRPLSS